MNQELETEENLDRKPSKTSCKVKIRHNILVDGVMTNKYEYQWITKPVSDLKGRPEDIRCPYCHGPIKLHFKGTGKKWKEDHFEHLGKKVGATDRSTCKAGEAFKGGEHKMSIRPVE